MAYYHQHQYYYNRHQQQPKTVEVVRRTRPNLLLQSYNTESFRIQIPADDELELMVPETLLSLGQSGISDPVILLTWRPKDIYSLETFKPVYELVAKPRALRIQTPTDPQAKTFQLDYEMAEIGFRQTVDQHINNRGLVLKFSRKQWIFEAIDLDPVIKHRVLSCNITSNSLQPSPPLTAAPPAAAIVHQQQEQQQFSCDEEEEEEREQQKKQQKKKQNKMKKLTNIPQIITLQMVVLFIFVLFVFLLNRVF